MFKMSLVTFNKKDKIWSGAVRPTIYNPNVGLGYLILNEFKKTPERITQVSADTGAQVTCYDMRQRSIKMVKHLQPLGLKQGDVVGVMASNSENLAPVVFACLTLGLPVNPLSPVMLESDVVQMFSKTRPKIIFCDFSVTETLKNAVNKIKSVNPLIYTFVKKIKSCQLVEDILSDSHEEEDEFTFPELVDVNNATAVILCSSGTTGQPKGVCRSHSQFIDQCISLWDINSNKQEVLLNFSAIYWSSGINYLVYGSLRGALRVITTEVFEPRLMSDICSRYGVTTVQTAPYAVSQILQTKGMKPFESIRGFMVGGSVVSKAMAMSLQRLLPNGKVWTGYGSSECSFVTDSFRMSRHGSCGIPAQNCRLRIIDEKGEALGPNERGEIWAKTKSPFLGYFGEPELTSETMVDGWVAMGDIGYFDDDGFLFFIARKKEMLKYNNYQVCPSELEEIIDEIDGVKHSCVVGVCEESSGNDLIFAFVVKDPEAKDLTAADIEKFVNAKVFDAKKLRGGVHFIDHMPLTFSGKILSREIKKLAAEIYNRDLKPEE